VWRLRSVALVGYFFELVLDAAAVNFYQCLIPDWTLHPCKPESSRHSFFANSILHTRYKSLHRGFCQARCDDEHAPLREVDVDVLTVDSECRPVELEEVYRNINVTFYYTIHDTILNGTGYLNQIASAIVQKFRRHTRLDHD
jgi:hypothetical protein